MANIYRDDFIGPLQSGDVRQSELAKTSKKDDVSFDVGEYEAISTAPIKPSGEVKGIKTDGFDASSFAKSLGYDSTGQAKSALGVSSLEDYYKKEGDRLAQNKKQAQEIGNAWDPIFSELDRRLGSIPTRQAQYEGRINQSTEEQLSDVERSRERSTESLESEKTRSLRNLEEDVRNQMDAAGRKIGVAGAGSSSAAGQASEAIARIGQKTRGNLLETVTQKLTDINNLASEQRASIGTWKNDKLFEITNYFQNLFDELSSQKANAQKDRKTAIQNLEYQAEQEYLNALRSLDQQVISYAQSVDMWERQRAAELEDYAMRMNASGQQGVQGVQESLAIFNSLLENGLTEDQAFEWMNAQGIYTLPEGVSGQREESPIDIYGTGYQNNVDPFAGLFTEGLFYDGF